MSRFQNPQVIEAHPEHQKMEHLEVGSGKLSPFLGAENPDLFQRTRLYGWLVESANLSSTTPSVYDSFLYTAQKCETAATVDHKHGAFEAVCFGML